VRTISRFLPWRANAIALAIIVIALFSSVIGINLYAQSLDTTLINFTCCSYSPAEITISVNDTVTWQGDFSSHPLVSEDGLWAMQTSGTTFSHTFLTTGTYRFYCNFHGGPGGVGMSGKIIVASKVAIFLPLIVR